MRYLYITVILTALAAAPISPEVLAQAPQGSGSPYSAYGLGDLTGTNQVSQALMGGVGIGLIDPFSVIQANPASYVSLRSPVFEVGVVARILQYETANASANGRRTDILGLSLGVPVGRGSQLQGINQPANRWGFALGVNPVSRVGYQISESGLMPNGSNDARFEYSGEGGLNRAFLGFGLTVWQSNDTINKGTRIAVGANLNYLFGSIEETRKVFYPSSFNGYNTSVATRLIIRSPTANAGIHLSGDVISMQRAEARLAARRGQPQEEGTTTISNRPAEPLRYTFGLTAELPASLAAERTQLVHSFTVGASGIEFPFDTAYYQDGVSGTVELPIQYGAGFSLYNSRWTFSAEHRRRDWSAFVVQVEDQEIRSQLTTHAVYALGASFRPAGDRRGTLLAKTTYRAGLRFSQDYRIVSDTQLQEIGMGFGMAVPVMSNTTRSRLTFGVELGERGTIDNGLLRERFANVFIGISITPDVREQWFKKRRLE